MAKMRLRFRLWFVGVGLVLASVGGIAFIAVINTYRLYSATLLLGIGAGAATAVICGFGIAFLVIGIRGKARTRRPPQPATT